MGLGKTIEVIALLLHRQQQSPSHGPTTLLICPTSLLGNWERELAKFSPSIPFFVHHGNNRDPLPKAFPPHMVVLTTYGVVRREEETFAARTPAEMIDALPPDLRAFLAGGGRIFAGDLRIGARGVEHRAPSSLLAPERSEDEREKDRADPDSGQVRGGAYSRRRLRSCASSARRH